jgi:phosphate starvation-inducible PhoH-like protein
VSVSFDFENDDEAQEILGIRDIQLRMIRDGFGIQAVARGRRLDLDGDADRVEQARLAVEAMLVAHRKGGGKSPEETLDSALQKFRDGDSLTSGEGDLFEDSAAPDGEQSPGMPRGSLQKIARTPGQARYLEAMEKHDIVMALGPAGTGKTYLAVKAAVEALKAGEVRKLILSRPAVEAGEKLGFLPGDFQQKVNPYLRPLYDALHEMLDYDQVRRYSDREIIEVVPLAYMRGRTLNNAFIILDEAQNTTTAQMKMFLTRMGARSRIVVTGDPTQLDLPKGQPSGLLHAKRVLGAVKGISWVELEAADIVRNRLVTRIVKAYERHEGGTP